MGLGNVRFVHKDVSEMDEKNKYDPITAFDAVHDQANPATGLCNMARALKPNGTFIMKDITASSRLERNLNDPLAATSVRKAPRSRLTSVGCQRDLYAVTNVIER